MLSDRQRDHLSVVLVRTRNPLNLGAAARAMSNFGLRHLRVVQPYDVAFREARSAVGAAELLKTAEEYDTVAEAVADCALVIGTTAIGRRKLQQPIRRLESGGKLICTGLSSTRIAILFGSEKTGLSNQDLNQCHWLLHIPTRPEHLSMNLGQAVAVVLYELSRQHRPGKSPLKSDLATASDLDRLTHLLVEAATLSGFVNPRSARSSQEKLRRLIRRLHFQVDDAELLLGILRQILWKLHRKP